MKEPDIFERAGLTLSQEQKQKAIELANEFFVISRGRYGLVELVDALVELNRQNLEA